MKTKKIPLTPDHPQAAQFATRLAERYWDAMTSNEEEMWLLQFLTSPQGQSHEFDEIRAVITFTALGKRWGANPSSLSRDAEPRSISKKPVLHRTIAAASLAGVCLAGAITLLHWQTSSLQPGTGTEKQPNVCVAYVGGQRITDEATIVAMMNENMQDMTTSDSEMMLEAELSDMLCTPKTCEP